MHVRRPLCIFYLDASDILVMDRKEIYRFDGEGNFKNRIGKVGHGHGEHGKISSLSFSRKKNMVFVGTFAGDVIKYSIEGSYVGKFSLDEREGIVATARWSDALGWYVYQTRIYDENGLDVYLKARDAEGKLRMTEKIYSDSEHVNTNLFNYGNLRDCEDGLLCLLPFEDRVFHVGKQGVDVLCSLNRGSHRPNRKLCEDVTQSEVLYQTKYLIENIVVTPRHFYLTIEDKEGTRDVIVDRKSNRIVHNHPNKGGQEAHLQLVDTVEYGFWPWGSTGNVVYNTVTLEDLDKASAAYIRGRLRHPVENQDLTSVVIAGYE